MESRIKLWTQEIKRNKRAIIISIFFLILAIFLNAIAGNYVDKTASRWYYSSMAKQSKRFIEALGMYERGLSIQEIATFYTVTRQAMWKILKRRGCIFRDKRKFGFENRFYRGTTANDYAQNALEYAIRKGIVERETICETCGDAGKFKDGRTKIQAHHPDYNKPLSVMWLCQKCHHEWHKYNKAIPRKGGGAR